MHPLNDDLRRTRELLSSAVNDFITWSLKWAEEKPNYKEAFAKAVAGATGTQQVRDAQATLDSMKEYRNFIKAEAMMNGLKLKVDALRAELSALQSEANVIKAERDLAMAAEHAEQQAHRSGEPIF